MDEKDKNIQQNNNNDDSYNVDFDAIFDSEGVKSWGFAAEDGDKLAAEIYCDMGNTDNAGPGGGK